MICGATGSQECDCVHLCQHTGPGLCPNQLWAEPEVGSEPCEAQFFKSPHLSRRPPSIHLSPQPPPPTLQLPLALEPWGWVRPLHDNVFACLVCVCVDVCVGVFAGNAYLQIFACACVCVCKTYGVQEPGVCYSLCSHTVFHQALSCSPQTLSIWFHSLEPPSAAARGWMISNTWEPWEPTQDWNNRGPVSAGALEESETAGGDDVRIIRTLPHLPQPLFPSHALIHECEISCVIGIYQQQPITSCAHACSCTRKKVQSTLWWDLSEPGENVVVSCKL